MIDHNSIIELEGFVSHLEGDLRRAKDTIDNEIVKTTFEYVFKMLNIHLDLKRLDFEKHALEMEKEYEKLKL